MADDGVKGVTRPSSQIKAQVANPCYAHYLLSSLIYMHQFFPEISLAHA